jgi:hypothetical protein
MRNSNIPVYPKPNSKELQGILRGLGGIDSGNITGKKSLDTFLFMSDAVASLVVKQV